MIYQPEMEILIVDEMVRRRLARNQQLEPTRSNVSITPRKLQNVQCTYIV